MGRLLTVTKDGALVEEYRYDPNGTRNYELNALRGISGRNFTYSEEDHLLTAAGTTYQYNLDGFLTQKTDGTNITQYVYSSRGELLRIDLPDGRIIEYLHDPLGRRIAKKINGTIVEKYLWRGLTRLLAVYDGSDNLLMRFEYADARMPAAVTTEGVTYYLAHDQVGSLRVVADSAGNVIKRVDYDSFGNIIIDTNETFNMPFGFAGGLHDRDSGLVRFGFRDYDPDVGRWTAKDPIFFAGGDTDLYGYVLDDPVNAIDPDGLWTFQIGLGFNAGAILGSSKSGGIIFGRNSETGKWQFGVYGTLGAGLQAGAGASGTLDLTWSPNKNITDVSGFSGTIGGSAIVSPPFFAGATAGTETNIPFNPCAKFSQTFSFGGGVGTPVEGHGFISYTYVKRFF
jgi:RHS repeat-associated protein